MPFSIIPTQYLGHAAGLATSCLWTSTSLFFTAASRRLGATAVNAIRIAMAVLLLGLTHWLLHGRWWPVAETKQIVLLGMSGVLGLAIGDQALFVAFVQIGPRLATLIMTTAPVFAALLGWVALGEKLAPAAIIGITCTVGGVAWVALERGPTVPNGPPHARTRGMVLAFIAALCQAGGLLLSKQGIGHGWLPEERFLDSQAATFVRMFFAALGMLPIVAFRWHRARAQRRAGLLQPRIGRARTGLLLAFGGSFVGPYLGVWMSLEAAHLAPLGVAQTLISLTPVLILPFSRMVYHEHISGRAICGAALAVGGVALLFLL